MFCFSRVYLFICIWATSWQHHALQRHETSSTWPSTLKLHSIKFWKVKDRKVSVNRENVDLWTWGNFQKILISVKMHQNFAKLYQHHLCIIFLLMINSVRWRYLRFAKCPSKYYFIWCRICQCPQLRWLYHLVFC